MLRIDCLLVNTQVAQTVRQIIGHLGHKAIAEDKDASFRSMYNMLRKNGVEIDLETAAHIYANELPLHDARFTPMEDLKYETGRWFDDVARAITLQKPRKGEKQIGELSPTQAVVKGIANAFYGNVSDDLTTKSILKTMEDTYREAAKRMLGELPNDTRTPDTRTTDQIVQAALEKEAAGHRNLADGTINGLAKMHDEVRKELGRLTDKMTENGEADKVEQWNNYAKSLEDAQYTMLFTSNEAKKILYDSLKEQGFVRTNKAGTELVDWQKLAGNINSYDQLRTNVTGALEAKGIDPNVSSRVADSMTKEFRDIRGKILETAERKQQGIADSWSDAGDKPKESVRELVDRRVQDWENYKKLKEDDALPLKFTQSEAKTLIGNALKNSERYGMEFGMDKRAIDWVKMAEERPSNSALRDLVEAELKKEGIKNFNRLVTSDALVRDYADTLFDRIDENSKRLLDQRQAALDRESPARKSALTRLGELHDLGLFEGAHDRLLAHVLGIDPQDVEAIRGIKEYAEKLSKLRQILGGNDFIVPSVVHTLNREIHSIIAPVIANKTKALRIVSAINKIYQVENSMLISTHGNILENHLSGAMELLTTNLSMRLKLGGELGGSKAQDRKVMADYYGHIAAGGAENGLAPYQVGGSKERMTDIYNLHKMKGADWSKPATWAKGMATAVLTIPRTFLSGADAAVKIGLMNSHMKGAVVDALSAGGKMSRDQAVEFYNDAIYGSGQLDKAKQRAEDIYRKIGMKYVSQKELNITANELLRENLLAPGALTPKVLDETMKNSYKQAGLGMGHESNNFISERQQAWKSALNRKENEAISEHDFDKASRIRLTNTIMNDVIFRFAASRFNWAWIRAEQAGGGILTGLFHYSTTNKKYRNADLFDAEKMREAAVEYQKARQKLFRGMIGIGVNTVGYLATKGIANALYPDQDDPMEAMFDDMKDNFFAKSLFLKVSPLWMLQSYEYNEIKQADASDKAIGALGKDFINLTNVGDSHDVSVQMAEAIKNISKGKTKKMRNKGFAQLGMVVNNSIPHVPLVRQGKNVMNLERWMTGQPQPPLPPYPSGFLQGLLGGGVIQDVMGNYTDDQLPEEFKGWGKEE